MINNSSAFDTVLACLFYFCCTIQCIAVLAVIFCDKKILFPVEQSRAVAKDKSATNFINSKSQRTSPAAAVRHRKKRL